VLALKDQAIANHYLLWAAIAFAQDDTAIGQEFCLAAVQRNPDIVKGMPSRLIRAFLSQSLADEDADHEMLLDKIIKQLPSALTAHTEQVRWAVAQGYLLRGTQAILWNRLDDGCAYFMRAATMSAPLDQFYLRWLTAQLLDYEHEFGGEAAQRVLQTLLPYLEKIGGRAWVRCLRGNYFVNKAFVTYRAGKYATVPGQIMRACASNPRYLMNRGVWSSFFRSLAGRDLTKLKSL
jgi:hypothetical protein